MQQYDSNTFGGGRHV